MLTKRPPPQVLLVHHSTRREFSASSAVTRLIFQREMTNSELIIVRGDSSTEMDFSGILLMFVFCCGVPAHIQSLEAFFLTHCCFSRTQKLAAHLEAEYQKAFLLHLTTLRLKGSRMATPRQPIHTSFLLTQSTEPEWPHEDVTLVRHGRNICHRHASGVCDI